MSERMKRIKLGAVFITICSVLYWQYLSPAGVACKAQGGTYYLNGDCGNYIWQPVPRATSDKGEG